MFDKQAKIYSLLLLAMFCALSACSKLAPPPPSSKATIKPKPPTAPCIVLALPSSGPYEAVATKIIKGSAMARQEMTAQGLPLRLEIVNTEDSRWLTSLSALPQECAIVGSPLQTEKYDELRQTGLTERRILFTFLPSLRSGDEGSRAWRFFPSWQDQIDALLAFATDGLNIRSFASFYPMDAFGERMTGLLEQSLAVGKNLPLQKASYPPGNVTTWSEAAATLIRPVPGRDGKNPIPQTAFEALFLPDSWKNMDMLTTSLLYNGEDRLVLLGTTLWEQGLSGKFVPNAEKYLLTVFPGAWNPATIPAALKTQTSDFWVGLGYDFIRFTARLGIISRVSSAEVNARVRALQMQWSMAPIVWDNFGVAHQKLWIFQVSPQGMTPVNMELFAQNRAAVIQRAALRMQGLAAVDEQGNPIVPLPGSPAQNISGSDVQPQQPGQPPALPLSSTPRPSYKLSLPQAR